MGQEGPLEEGLAIHSSTPAWRTHGQGSLAGRSAEGHGELDTTEGTDQASTGVSDHVEGVSQLPVWGEDASQ